jgi:hypothetical protein
MIHMERNKLRTYVILNNKPIKFHWMYKTLDDKYKRLLTNSITNKKG